MICGCKLCLYAARGERLLPGDIPVLARAGYDGFFADYVSAEDTREFARVAKREGMLFSSIHAPFGDIDKMWKEGEAGDAVLLSLEECVDVAARFGVPVVVSHVWIGFGTTDLPTEVGFERFSRLISFAAGRGVELAFENTEGEEFLAALFARFGEEKGVRFCWDSGHEQCYNGGKDLLARYGRRLAVTHLNDNLGVSEPGRITWLDDLHLVPFDGAVDWLQACRRLAKTGFDGPLTFELSRTSKPGRHENDRYMAASYEEYIARTFAAARRIAEMFVVEKRRLAVE